VDRSVALDVRDPDLSSRPGSSVLWCLGGAWEPAGPRRHQNARARRRFPRPCGNPRLRASVETPGSSLAIRGHKPPSPRRQGSQPPARLRPSERAGTGDDDPYNRGDAEHRGAYKSAPSVRRGTNGEFVQTILSRVRVAGCLGDEVKSPRRQRPIPQPRVPMPRSASRQRRRPQAPRGGGGRVSERVRRAQRSPFTRRRVTCGSHSGRSVHDV
jgi:hypothetical protein